ncbi:hypothetical protein [Dethiobacter alkaliphilus]|nr:hypothetical protein [Dethiobacter alkaliphilus]MCW3491586.1 hypothetical protein [Dethiobacter alkaliphilus]
MDEKKIMLYTSLLMLGVAIYTRGIVLAMAGLTFFFISQAK